jgi:UDP-N-acetylmuramyl pentapeptide synthase
LVIINNDNPLLASYNFGPTINIIYCGSKDTDDIQLIDVRLNADNKTSTVHIRINHTRIDYIRNKHIRNEHIRNEYIRNEYIRNKHIRMKYVRNKRTETNNTTDITFTLNGICRHNALNSCLAIASAVYFNIPIEIIRRTMNKFTLYKNRGLITVNPEYTLYDYTYNCIPTACLNNLENFKILPAMNKLIIIGLSAISPNFINYESSIIPILNYSMTITNHIILYPTDAYIVNKADYKDIIHCNTFDDIIEKIKLLTANDNKLSVFMQAENNLELYKLVDIIQPPTL